MSRRKGVYILLLHLEQGRTVEVGSLGPLDFPASWYAYIGSAGNGLENRLGRHLRVPVTRRWHIDHLNCASDGRRALLWEEGSHTECGLAEVLSSIGAQGVHPGFGSSDCRCRTHLFSVDEAALERLLEVPRDGEMTAEAPIEWH